MYLLILDREHGAVFSQPGFKIVHLQPSSRGSLPPDSGGRRFVARGLERGKLPVWPHALGEHADQLGAQTDSDCTFGRTGLQRGALNNLFTLSFQLGLVMECGLANVPQLTSHAFALDHFITETSWSLYS